MSLPAEHYGLAYLRGPPSSTKASGQRTPNCGPTLDSSYHVISEKASVRRKRMRAAGRRFFSRLPHPPHSWGDIPTAPTPRRPASPSTQKPKLHFIVSTSNFSQFPWFFSSPNVFFRIFWTFFPRISPNYIPWGELVHWSYGVWQGTPPHSGVDPFELFFPNSNFILTPSPSPVLPKIFKN